LDAKPIYIFYVLWLMGKRFVGEGTSWEIPPITCWLLCFSKKRVMKPGPEPA